MISSTSITQPGSRPPKQYELPGAAAAVNSGQSDETIPLGVFLVKSDCNEEKLLFRFPYTVKDAHSANVLLRDTSGEGKGGVKPNKYALQMSMASGASGPAGSLRGGGGATDQETLIMTEHGHLPTAGIDDQQTSSGATSSASSVAAALLPSFAELISSSNLLTLDANDQDEISKVIGITDSTFSNLFGVLLKSKLCIGSKFELKVDNVRFVGHPSQLSFSPQQQDNHSSSSPFPGGGDLCFHIVFALKANAPADVVNCYHDLSKRLATALKSEEARCGYFTRETKIMTRCHDELATALANASRDGTSVADLTGSGSGLTSSSSPPYSSILERSKLAKSLQTVFRQLLNDGLVQVRINSLVSVHFCLPQKVHRKLLLMAPTVQQQQPNQPKTNSTLSSTTKLPLITPDSIHECFRRLRPYHTFLLLVNAVELVESLPPDVSSPVICLVKMASPLKNLIELSADAGISLPQTFNVVAQLVYWGKATVIFPICETNVYVLHPNAVTDVGSPLVDQFEARFGGGGRKTNSTGAPGSNSAPEPANGTTITSTTTTSATNPANHILDFGFGSQEYNILECRPSLHLLLSKFSPGVSLGQLRNPLLDEGGEQAREWVKVVEWMLQKRLLMQLHTYVLFFPLAGGSPYLGRQGRLSFTLQQQQQQNAQQQISSSSTSQLDRPPSAFSTVELLTNNSDACSTIASSSYQSESSILSNSAGQLLLGTSPSGRESSSTAADHHHHLYSSSRGHHHHPRVHTTSLGSEEQLLLLNGGGITPSNGSKGDLLLEVATAELMLRSQEEAGGLQLSPEEVKAVLAVPAAANLEDIRLFARLLPYFDGHHHVEDMMHYENLRRSQILTLVDKFREVLLVYQYEDTTVDTLQPYNTL